MKTAVTIINTVQTGMDNYKDMRITKVFEDSATILEIKEWVKSVANNKLEVDQVSMAVVDISDVKE